MMNNRTYAAAHRLLRQIARKAVEYAMARNKAGIVRMRYLARHVYDLLPLGQSRRLSDQTCGEIENEDDDAPKRKH